VAVEIPGTVMWCRLEGLSFQVGRRSGTGLWEPSSLESQKGTIERYEKLDAGDGEAA
jgi:hypothetical protein